MQRAIFHGFLTNLLMWTVALVAHFPPLHIPSWGSGLALIVTFLACIALGARGLGKVAWKHGTTTGLVSGLLNLLLLGSLLVEQPTAGSPQSGLEGLRPNALLAVGGFLVACAVAGAIAAVVGAAIGASSGKGHADSASSHWLARFAKLLAWSLVPLILVGGLVTSADAGMSVRGWPGSDGALMFLYPISLMTDTRVFFEHSHRLLGMLVGLTSIVTMVWVLVQDRRLWIKALAVGIFVLVCVQGYLGGARVNIDSRVIGLIHGISAQIIMALAWVLAACLSGAFRHEQVPAVHPLSRRLRRLSTALIVGLVLQVALGAAFRHLGAGRPGMIHMIYTHAALAIVLVILGALVGFGLKRAGDDLVAAGQTNASPGKRVGSGLTHALFTQFVLGWVTLWAVFASRSSGAVPGPDQLATTPPVPPLETYIATLHQTLGAAIFSLAAVAALWIRRLLRA